MLNPNKAGNFEVSFFLGGGRGQSDPQFIFQEERISNINITLYNC